MLDSFALTPAYDGPRFHPTTNTIHLSNTSFDSSSSAAAAPHSAGPTIRPSSYAPSALYSPRKAGKAPTKSAHAFPTTPSRRPTSTTAATAVTPSVVGVTSPYSQRGAGGRPSTSSTPHSGTTPIASHRRQLSFGDRFIPNQRDMQEAHALSHYFLTESSSSDLLLGGMNNTTTTASAMAMGGASTAPNAAILEASSPAFAGSPNASPTRRNTQNRAPTEGGAGPASGVGGVSRPYSNSLAKALFPESVTSQGGTPSVLGFKSTNTRRPSALLFSDDDTDYADSAVGVGSSTASCVGSPLSSPLGFLRTSQSEKFRQSQGVVYQENRARNFQSKSFRVIPQTPERILDAPELLDDFYLNLLDWSSQNTLAVALGSTAYLWNAEDGSIAQLMSAPQRDNIITAVSWHGDGSTISIGLNDGTVQLWDAETQQNIRTIAGHGARVCSLSWNGGLLASGSRDTTIHLHDKRDPLLTGVVRGHTQEVCGLRWSPNGAQLASGGNDNLLNIWDFRRSAMEVVPLWQLNQHAAAVKALAWNPKQPTLLCSGGGTADKTLRFWDTTKGECVNMIDTLSQVCGVMWNNDGTELVSSHGYSDNQLTLWKYPSLKRLADLTGHTSRVLHLSMSPDGQTVVSAAGDETIRFWRCFAPDTASASAAATTSNPFYFSSPHSSALGSSGLPLYFNNQPSGAAGGGASSPNRNSTKAGSTSASSASAMGGGMGALFDQFDSAMLR